jgi:hypothetical protein
LTAQSNASVRSVLRVFDDAAAGESQETRRDGDDPQARAVPAQYCSCTRPHLYPGKRSIFTLRAQLPRRARASGSASAVGDHVPRCIFALSEIPASGEGAAAMHFGHRGSALVLLGPAFGEDVLCGQHGIHVGHCVGARSESFAILFAGRGFRLAIVILDGDHGGFPGADDGHVGRRRGRRSGFAAAATDE